MFNTKAIDDPLELFANLSRLEVDLAERLKQKSRAFAPLQDDSEKETMYVEALLSRIRFQRLFYRSHYLLSDPAKADLPQALKCVKSAIDEFNVIQRQHAELFSTEESDLAIAFDPKITIRVSSASVLKPIEVYSFTESSKSMERYLDNLTYICNAKRNCTSLTQLLKFFNDFSQIPNTTVVIRSRLMFITLQDTKIFGTSIRDLLLKYILGELPMLNDNHRKLFKAVSLGEGLLPPDVMRVDTSVEEDEDTQLKRDCDEWLNMMANVFMAMLNGLCSNPSTQRRKIAHLIGEWGVCEQRAEMIDLTCIDELREMKRRGEEGFTVAGKEHLFALTYFCIELTTDAIYRYLLMGFDLQLYHRTELHHVYWYLDYISGLRIQNLNKILQKIVYEEPKKKGKKKKEKTKEGKLVPVEPSPDQRVLRLILEVDTLLTRASCRFLDALLISYNENGIENLFNDGTLPNVLPELRFERRFQPFYTVAQPPPVRYESYSQHLRGIMKEITPVGLLSAATDHYVGAKKLIDASLTHMESILSDSVTEKLKALSKVAQGNQISIMVATMKVKQGGGVPLPLMDFSFSSQYPVIKLPSK
jgi:hypothetical protein